MWTGSRDHFLLPDAPFASYAEYLAAVGGPLAKALPASPEAIVDLVRESGLRGRGGAGFSAGAKWRSIASHPCPTRFVVCNAAEGEPGTFKDRWLLRQNPYAVLEGLYLGALAVRAERVYIATKASFGPELARVRAALEEMRAAHTFVGVRFTIVEGPDEYLFGEEKALLSVIEGDGPLPREADKPPYEIGLFASVGSPNPALVSNAETFAHASTIIRHGVESFRAVGTRDTPGTLLVTLSGDVAHEGVFEVPAGVPLEQIFQEQGGGSRDGHGFKAALSGVSAAVIMPDRFGVHAEFGAMLGAGLGLGSAGFVLYGQGANMVRVTQAIARFLYVESCNQCSACKTELGIASSALDELSRSSPRFDEDHPPPPSSRSRLGVDILRGDSQSSSGYDVPARALVAARRAPQGNRCYLPVEGSVVIPSLLRAFAAEFAAEARAPSGAPPALVPKLVDLDARTGRFTIDAAQARKEPNWTYRDEPKPAATASGRAYQPRPGAP